MEEAGISEMEQRQREWQLRKGQYLGEISALCFLHLHASPQLPYLLAGTGSQVLLFELSSGKMVTSFQVFEGIRVHGISLESFADRLPESDAAFRVAVFGERRVKLFSLLIRPHIPQNLSSHDLEWALIHSLPMLSHWVLDVIFLKEVRTSYSNGNSCLAVGCSDNSVSFWDTSRLSFISQVRSSERCLLYSMRMWGDRVESLSIASGTIYNEIIIWKVDCQKDASGGSGLRDHSVPVIDQAVQSPYQQYQDVHLCRLTGHEGSIFRLTWSFDGLRLASVSDDRSARIWAVPTERGGSCKPKDVKPLADSRLFGHTARVWDCCIFDHLIVTAGEDCTCRLWKLDGTQLKMIREHTGRGVWRCLYDPASSVLVTSGFDSAIKVHQIRMSFSNLSETHFGMAEDCVGRKELFRVCIPNSLESSSLMDSKSEYVRCLQFSREDSVYVATNNGYLYHTKLYDTGDVKWTTISRISENAPIICMDVLSNSDTAHGIEDWVAAGDGRGVMTIVQVVGDVHCLKAEISFAWSAELDRQLLGTFWCSSLGYRFIFTADPRGIVKLWRLFNDSSSVSCGFTGGFACLVSKYVSSFGIRIACLNASLSEEVLLCGDIRGNLLLFPLERNQLFGTSVTSETEISPLVYFKGAHGISTVCSISIASASPNRVLIHSTGGDGCICYLEYDMNVQSLRFMGMKQVKEVSMVRSVFPGAHLNIESSSRYYAIGFTSSDLIIWNLNTETKVVQVGCGGWRRPHSYFLGDVPEIRNCIAFVKDGVIYIHRLWMAEKEKIFPRSLHLQFHGREIHSLCFISYESSCISNKKRVFSRESCMIATGCEDGTVRLTRYHPETENWAASELLGEHVGGSAVRSIFYVTRMYTIFLDSTDVANGLYTQKGSLEDQDNFSLLISVGAKKVVTAWNQKTRMSEKSGRDMLIQIHLQQSQVAPSLFTLKKIANQ